MIHELYLYFIYITSVYFSCFSNSYCMILTIDIDILISLFPQSTLDIFTYNSIFTLVQYKPFITTKHQSLKYTMSNVCFWKFLFLLICSSVHFNTCCVLSESSLPVEAQISNRTHLHAEDSLDVSLQSAQQQSVLGVPHADGAVIGADQQDPPGSLL